MISDDTTERLGFKTAASFSVFWITYEKFPTTYIPGGLGNICVLDIILLC